MNNYCEVDKTDRTDLGKCMHLYDEKKGNNETQALSAGKLSSSGARKKTDHNKRRRKQRRRQTRRS